MQTLRINRKDNVVVALTDIKKGEQVRVEEMIISVREDIKAGHKLALMDIEKGVEVVKYGFPIGQATTDIKRGEWVHIHNLHTGLADILEYTYEPAVYQKKKKETRDTFMGYRREDGKTGIRNEIWVIPTVSCVNRIAEIIVRQASKELTFNNIEGIYEFKHPYGCSQVGDDHLATQKILANLVKHPNAGGVLVLGLGCENNQIKDMMKVLGDYNPKRVKFLVAQEVEDEIEVGVSLIKELVEYASGFERQQCPVSDLIIGHKCGGSDAFSGITANPLVGNLSDMLITQGGTAILTEVPEMFGAETILMNRAKTREIFLDIVKLINDFKSYYKENEQPVFENPSPGNKEGGITTLEEKSLGCIAKGGESIVEGVLGYTDIVNTRGLNLLNAPGNDMIASTALAAAGCQIVLFTTGRGTPLGTCVPTVKIATNSRLYEKKNSWMDFNAGSLLDGKSMESMVKDLKNYILSVSSGKLTRAEELGFREIAIFKTGVTL